MKKIILMMTLCGFSWADIDRENPVKSTELIPLSRAEQVMKLQQDYFMGMDKCGENFIRGLMSVAESDTTTTNRSINIVRLQTKYAECLVENIQRVLGK